MSLSEAELHGLVDGHIDADRRADVLRRLAASPSDRALVEAWQEQTDTIRAAFREVDREPLPAALDLAPPRLRCIETTYRPSRPSRESGEARRGGIAAAATLCVVACGLVGSWLMITQAARQDGSAPPTTTLEASLAARAVAALDAGGTVGRMAEMARGLPTVRIPDLTNAGLTLTGVSSEPSEPASLVLRYSDSGDGRLVVDVSRIPPGLAASAPAPVGRAIAWRQRGAALALAGTLPAAKLRAIAAVLHAEAGQD